MRIFRLALIFTLTLALAATRVFAQTSPPPSLLGQATHAPAKASVAKPKPKPARRVPVVRAGRNIHAVKVKPRKPAIGKAAVPAAAAAALGAVAATPTAKAPAATPATPPTPAPADATAAVPALDPSKGATTGLAIPRFMSLRFDDVNLRVGPGIRYPIDWVYHRRNLPVEILRELDDWRLVQDQDNIRGWVRAPALSPRRSVAVLGADRTLRAKPDDTAAPVALLKPGVIGHVRGCAANGAWCEIEVSTYRGWLKRSDVYGIYPTEAVGG